MARQQVLSTLQQNQSQQMQQIQSSSKSAALSARKTDFNQSQSSRMRSDSLSSLSSTSSQASSSRGRFRKTKGIPSMSVSPDENRVKKDRLPFVDMFSPVRAIRAARAGMKRKRGGGAVTATSTRGTILRKKQGAEQKKGASIVESSDANHAADLQRKIRGTRLASSREASNSSLQRGMKAMVLSDNETDMMNVRPVASTRKVSASTSIRSSTSHALHHSGREESEDEAIDDAEEDDRLLLQAPSWQLHRLKKSKLHQLHIILGTWQENEQVDLDLYTKQELVEGLIKARSSSRHSVYAAEISAEPASSFSSPTSVSKSASRRRTTAMTASTINSHSSGYTDEEASESETEANDAGGEETEAEPIKASARRHDARMSRLYLNQGTASPMLHRLRHSRQAPLAANTQVYRDTTGKASMSSSRLSSPLGRRLRPSRSTLFAACSPIRTRRGARSQAGRPTLPAGPRGEATIREVFPRRGDSKGAQTPLQQRRKTKTTKSKSVAFGWAATQEGSWADQQEWEDASPTSLRAAYSLHPPRRAKLRAQEQLHQLHETEFIEAQDEHNMSVDDTPTKTSTLEETPTRLSTTAGKGKSETIQDCGSNDWQLHESDVNASPSKMRKLRNGKIRLLGNNTTVKELSGQEEPDDDEYEFELEDVDMDDAEEVDSKLDDKADTAMDAPSASSLSRLRRQQLVELCERHDINVAADATKASLVDALMMSRDGDGEQAAHAPASTDSSGTVGPESSSSAQTNLARRSMKQRESSGRRSRRLSDKPLLLRSQSKEVQMSKPPSPVPSGAAQSANLAGEDELNGLDLESLNLVDKEIPFSKLEKLEKIGSGGFKDVYIGKYQISKKTTKKVAIADIRDQLSEMDIKELTLLRDLKHENIVRFIGVCVPPLDMRRTPCMIVSELCSNGDLFDYIRNVPAPPDEEIFRLMLETARGLEYLHTRKPAIIHRDCKSTNVLVTRNRTAKINDFGLARVRNTKRSMIKSLVGTVNWQAVELWSPKPNYNEKVDVWSAAMTFWETLQWHQPEKKYPFQDMNEHQIYQDVGHKKLRPSTVSIRRKYGGEIVDLLDEMWDHNAKERPTMTQVCQRLEELIELKKQLSRAKNMPKPIR